MTWRELADRIFVRRYDHPFDHNVGLVLGAEQALVIDSRSNPRQAEELLADLASVTGQPIGWLFNTHHHWDHTFGNQRFLDSRIWGHRRCAETLIEAGEATKKEVSETYPDDESYRDVAITPPTELFEERATIDLGDRSVELVHYGRGHTDNDAVLHVGPVTFAGDLVEEGSPPSFGDSFPIAWVETVGRLAEAANEVIVPGHGAPVDAEHLVVARFDLAWVGRAAKAGKAAGLGSEEIELDDSPYPEETAREALARAYSELDSKFSQ
ncbi:MAG TPA: MBL fold metallo-hydrolase [Acidimicrobiia bacterium]|nr:MBL fold metallo-hydrolase [Acidimicrobiia bacterium]